MLRSRREVMTTLALGAAAMLVMAPRRVLAAAETRGGPSLGIDAGARFAGSIVTSVGPVTLGALPVRLTDSEGRGFTVDLLRYDPETPGVARAGSLSAFVSNDGDGVLATHEEHGLAAMAIASLLAARESAGARLPSLLTLRERSLVRTKARTRA
jgi:hypothetical protein